MKFKGECPVDWVITVFKYSNDDLAVHNSTSLLSVRLSQRVPIFCIFLIVTEMVYIMCLYPLGLGNASLRELRSSYHLPHG